MTARFHALGLAECGTERVSAHTFYNLHGASQGRKMKKTFRLTALSDILRVFPRNT